MDISAISKKNSPKSRMIYHEDPQALHIGTLPKHCYFIPFAPGEDSFSARENSSRFKLLNGEWDFSYYDSIVDMEDDFTVLSGSEKMPVPSNWQDHGYGLHQYTNTRYPFPFDPPYVPHENPCGAYVKTFHYSRPEGTASYHLNFEGVDSCYYVWLNGAFIG